MCLRYCPGPWGCVSSPAPERRLGVGSRGCQGGTGLGPAETGGGCVPDGDCSGLTVADVFLVSSFALFRLPCMNSSALCSPGT